MAARPGWGGLTAGSGGWRAEARRRSAEGGEEVAVEEIIEWLGALAAGDVFTVDVEALEDGLVEQALLLIAGYQVGGLNVVAQVERGVEVL
ncbi:MAG: hypothetical protein ACSLFR_18090 [Solirubrobacteraceae bacterium]